MDSLKSYVEVDDCALLTSHVVTGLRVYYELSDMAAGVTEQSYDPESKIYSSSRFYANFQLDDSKYKTLTMTLANGDIRHEYKIKIKAKASKNQHTTDIRIKTVQDKPLFKQYGAPPSAYLCCEYRTDFKSIPSGLSAYSDVSYDASFDNTPLSGKVYRFTGYGLLGAKVVGSKLFGDINVIMCRPDSGEDYVPGLVSKIPCYVPAGDPVFDKVNDSMSTILEDVVASVNRRYNEDRDLSVTLTCAAELSVRGLDFCMQKFPLTFSEYLFCAQVDTKEKSEPYLILSCAVNSSAQYYSCCLASNLDSASPPIAQRNVYSTSVKNIVVQRPQKVFYGEQVRATSGQSSELKRNIMQISSLYFPTQKVIDSRSVNNEQAINLTELSLLQISGLVFDFGITSANITAYNTSYKYAQMQRMKCSFFQLSDYLAPKTGPTYTVEIESQQLFP